MKEFRDLVAMSEERKQEIGGLANRLFKDRRLTRRRVKDPHTRLMGR